jgi:hypothetical protein
VLIQCSARVASQSFTVTASGSATILASTGPEVGRPIFLGLTLLITGALMLWRARRREPAA